MAEFCPDLASEEFPESLVAAVTDANGNKRRTVNIVHRLANSPTVAKIIFSSAQDILQSLDLDPKLREIAICTVGRLTGSTYEFMQHLAIARAAGVEETKLRALSVWRGHPSYTEVERAVLQFTEELTANAVSKETKETVIALLPLKERVELAWVVAFYGAFGRLANVLDVPLESAEPDFTATIGRKAMFEAPASGS
jgi:4-carboxymuconolactone decarboxylase